MSDSFDERLVTRLRNLPTAAISDALDAHDVVGVVPGVRPLFADARTAGPAFTVSYEAIGRSGGTVGDFLDDVPPGAVIVIDNHGRADITVWGGLMTEAAIARGVAGTVIDGACRDIEAAIDAEYPLFSRAQFMRTGKDRVRLRSVQIPVRLGDVEVLPGAAVCADADGVVVVPASLAETVVRRAEQIVETELQIVAAVRAGTSLRRARADHGYHELQRQQ